MAAVLKRKRSDSEISTTSSLLSSPISFNSFMAIDSFQSHPQIQTPSLFASRTRKRHRDNRPSEADVHQHTLSLLFSAQNNSHPQTLPQSQQPQAPTASLPMNPEPISHQSSLHSFFNIPSARQSSPASIASSSPGSVADTPTYATAMSSLCPITNCEDCSAPLGQGGDSDAMDVDSMDVDVANGGNYLCEQCGKAVCHGCAISNLGEQRRCLNCAVITHRRWVGGLGWI